MKQNKPFPSIYNMLYIIFKISYGANQNIQEFNRTRIPEHTSFSLKFGNDPKKLHIETKIPLAMIYRTINRIKSEKRVQRKPGSGQQPLLKRNDRRKITTLALRNSLMSCSNIAKEVAWRGSPKVSETTVWRSLKRSGYLKWTPRIVLKLT